MSSDRFTRADVDLSGETFVFRPFRRGRQSIRYARRTWDSKFGVPMEKGGPSDRQDRRSASLRQSYIRHQLISDCPDASSRSQRNDRISSAREEADPDVTFMALSARFTRQKYPEILGSRRL